MPSAASAPANRTPTWPRRPPARRPTPAPAASRSSSLVARTAPRRRLAQRRRPSRPPRDRGRPRRRRRPRAARPSTASGAPKRSPVRTIRGEETAVHHAQRRHQDHGRRHADPHLGEGERRRLGRDGHVGCRDQADATGPGMAVRPGRDRHRALDDPREDVGHAVRRRAAPLGEVGARAEHGARAGQDDAHARRCHASRHATRAWSSSRRRGRERVAVVRRVQRERCGCRRCARTPTNASVTGAQCRGTPGGQEAEKCRWYRSPVIESDEHQLFRKTLRDLFEREIEPHVDEWEAARTFPAHELFPKLGGRRAVRARVRRGLRRHGRRSHLHPHRRRGDGPDQLRRRADGDRRADVHVDAGARALRVARAEGAVSRTGDPRRGRDLHRGDRARRRERRRRHPHPGRARRRRVGHQRRRSSSSRTAPRRTGSACWPGPPRSPVTGACR